jgi:hypothetical protein
MVRIERTEPRLIMKLFEWYATGNYSLLEIVNKVHEEGLSPEDPGSNPQKRRA